MKLGFLTRGDVADVRFAAREGFDCVELALFGDTPLLADHAEFARALGGEGVALAAVSQFGRNYRDPDGAKRKAEAELWARTADLAAALPTDLFVSGSGQDPAVPDPDQLDAVVDELGPRIEALRSRGLRFAFYNCHWVNVVDRPSAWEKVLPRLPGAGVKFDPSHPVYDGRDWLAELVAAAPNLLHTHAKDVLFVNGKPLPDPNPGLGQIAWGPFFAVLYEANYAGAVCIEPHSKVYRGERLYDFLALSGRYLRQFLLEEGDG